MSKLSFKGLFIVVLFLLIPIVLLLRLNQKGTTVQAEWWNDSWMYRQAINISSHTIGETGVYIIATVNIGDTTKAQTDSGDFRFTNITGQLLDYYISSNAGTTAPTFHIYFDSFPAEAQTIYAYYDNPSASNGFAAADFTTQASNYTVGSYSAAETGGGPVAWWKFDEGVGTTIHDSSGNGNYGTMAAGTSAPTWTATGLCVSQGCLSFDGVGNSATINSSTNLNPSSALTTEFWIKDTSTPAVGGGTTTSSGPLSPGTMADSNAVGTVTWSNPDNAKVSNDTYTTISAKSGTSHFLKASNIGFTIPDGSTIEGIVVEIERKTAIASNESWSDSTVKIVKSDGTFGTTNKSTGSGWSTTESYVSYGGSSDLWGELWSSTDINDPDFGVAFSVVRSPLDTLLTVIAYVDHIRITVYYTIPTAVSQIYVGKGRDSYQIETDGSGGIIGYLNTGTTVATTITQNSWHHVAMTYDGTNQKLYVDSVLKSTTPLSGAIGTNSNALTIGSKISGQIDDVKVFPYARTATQIKQDYTSGLAGQSSAQGANVNIGGTGNETHSGNLIAYYKFDEGYGTVANNSGSVGSTLNAIIGSGTSAPVWTTNGRINKALNFDVGNTQATVYFDDTTGSLLDLTNDFSFGTWVYRTGTPSSQARIISKGDLYLLFTSNNNIPLCYMGNLSPTTLTATSALPLNSWTHVLCTYKDHVRKLYINGSLNNQDTPTGTIDTSNLDLVIGNYDSPSASYRFRGIIDEVKIYNYALTDAEVKIDYNQGAAFIFGSSSQTIGATTTNLDYCIPGDTTYCVSPIAEWKMDEGIGTTAFDSGGNNYNGLVGTGTSAPTWSPGKVGKSLSFNGTNQKVTLSTLPSITAPYTVDFWFYPRSLPGAYQTLLSLRGANSYPTFNITQTNKLLVYAGAEKYLYGGKTFTTDDLNRWWHVTFVVADSSSLTNWKIYLNGSNISSTPGGNTGTYYDPSTTGSIGNNISERFFNGFIDQVRIYNYARTPAQISYDYNKGAPVGWWKLDECQGSIAYDSSGIGNTGSISIGSAGSQNSLGTCSLGTSAAWTNGATGKWNSSLNLDGSDDYVNISETTTDMRLTTNQTISVWINFSSNTSWRGITGRVSGANRSYALWMDSDGDVLYEITGSGTCNIWRNGGSGDIANLTGNSGWHLVTGTYNGQTGALYIDGKSVYSADCSVTPYSSAGNFTIGSYVGFKFAGKIDDVRIYNYALTATQVKTLYNDGAVNFR